jgi:signal transduction histidine kinase
MSIGIRLKIALGFALLTIVVVSAVSFWAAQSLGVSIDSSDYDKLESLKNSVISQLAQDQQELDRLGEDTANALIDMNFFAHDADQQQRLAEKLKTSLNLDWLEIFQQGNALLQPYSSFVQPGLNRSRLLRLTGSGPFSYRGYLVTASQVGKGANTTLFLARRPSFHAIPLLCIYDDKGILYTDRYLPEPDFLKKLTRENVTDQVMFDNEVFRIRAFKENAGANWLLVGYAAQRATISRADIDQLMLRLAVLEVVGLLILGYFLGQRMLSPLNALRHGIEQVAAGHWKEIPLNEAPMKNSGDEIENVAHSFNHMVRELSLAQNRLIEVQKELATKEKMAALGRFSAGIAHEINNPLGTILVTAGMLKEAAAKNGSPVPEEFDEIIEETKRCRDIIATLRTYTGRMQPGLMRMRFAAFFDQIQSHMAAIAEFSDLELVFSSTVADDELLVDIKAMHQVFYNLIRNAGEAMSEKASRYVNIVAARESDHFTIRVQDTGAGFQCLPEHIFEPLFTTKARGTGLGLVICQAIIDGHHGHIEARRIEDRMTEFCISLPIALPDNDKPGDDRR